MGKTTNILDLNNRLTKVEKEKVAQNSYTSLKNKPKINNVTLTGNKSASDLGLVEAVAGKGLSTNDYTDADKAIVGGVTSALAGKVSTSSVGSANGVAELDANGRVPSSQLPSYVDDLLEYADLAHFPATGETGKIYIAVDTGKTYRWSGSGYAEISESLALGETSSTAYAGNKGKANADAIAAIKGGLTDLKNDILFGDLPSNGFDPLTQCNGFFCYSVYSDKMPLQGRPNNYSDYGTIFGCSGTRYKLLVYIDVNGKLAVMSQKNTWVTYSN